MFIRKTEQELNAMRAGGKILAGIVRELVDAAAPGISTRALDELAARRIKERGASPSFLGYRDYPAVLCVSVNEQAVHSIPSDRILQEGDLLKLDFGIVYQGMHTDMAVTVLVTEHNRLALKFKRGYALRRKLIRVTREALERGIAQLHPGKTLGDVGAAIEEHVRSNGFKILKELGGHGVGKVLHEEPFIANYGRPGTGEKIPVGAVVALEPIVAVGTDRIEDGPDGFTYQTTDGSLAAHFEHTVAVTADGPVVLTA